MPKAVLTENSVQWFTDNKYDKKLFLEYYFKEDRIEIYDEEAYYSEGSKIGHDDAFSCRACDWIPSDCTCSTRLAILEKVYNKRLTYNIMNYMYVPTKLIRWSVVKPVVTENSIQIFSACTAYQKPFVECDFDSYELKIYDKETYALERYAAKHDFNFVLYKYKFPIKNAWYPENCNPLICTIISCIMDNDYLEHKEIMKKVIDEYKKEMQANQ